MDQRSGYPLVRSVLIMDSCQIYHTETLQEVLNGSCKTFYLCDDINIMMLYLPPYSPDLSPLSVHGRLISGSMDHDLH